MSELIESLVALVQQIITSIGYPGITFVMFAENVFPPIPSELVMPFAGFLVGRGEFDLIPVWIAGTLGAVLGAVVLYYLGVWAGDAIIRRFIVRYGRWLTLSEGDYDRALRFFARYGEWVVLFGRCIPLVRSLISLPAGAERMPMPRFLFYTTIGSAIWTGLLTYAGVVLGENWEDVLGLIEQYQDVVMVVVIALGVAFVAWLGYRIITRRGSTPAPTETTPSTEG
jgi:membrane protein DedA with SNARE-associated domain